MMPKYLKFTQSIQTKRKEKKDNEKEKNSTIQNLLVGSGECNIRLPGPMQDSMLGLKG